MKLSTKFLSIRSNTSKRLAGRTKKISRERAQETNIEHESLGHPSDLSVYNDIASKGASSFAGTVYIGILKSQPSSTGSDDSEQQWGLPASHSKRSGTFSLSSENPKKAQGHDATPPPKTVKPSMLIGDPVQYAWKAVQRWIRDQTYGLSEIFDNVDAQLSALKQLCSLTAKNLKRWRAHPLRCKRARPFSIAFPLENRPVCRTSPLFPDTLYPAPIGHQEKLRYLSKVRAKKKILMSMK